MSENEGYIGKFLKKADVTVHEGIKKADEVLADAVEVGAITAKEASKTGKKLSQKALKEQAKIQKLASKKLEDGIKSAKGMTGNSMRNLEIIEKLGELREKGFITETEFRAKKKKLLEGI